MSQKPASAPKKVIVIGAGLAGLSCAVRLHEAGVLVEVFEASDGVGGRVRTDSCDGFLLDRGFQIYLNAYREAGQFLDLKALNLHGFEPGALVWRKNRLWTVMDVFRRPFRLFSSATAPIGTVGDKLRVALLRYRLSRKTTDQIWASREETTARYLRQFGFSETFIDGFFRSFYGGIFLEDQLETSSRLFEFTYKMFTEGSATLPAKGIQAIPDQLAARLPADLIHLNCPVRSIEGTRVHLDAAVIEASHIIVATDGEMACQFLPWIPKPKWKSTSCLYFAADRPPLTQPLIVLKGDRQSLINNLSVPSLIAPGYAPVHRALISVSLLGDHSEASDLTGQVRQELAKWFAQDVTQWQHLRTYHIRQALPLATVGNNSPLPRREGIHVCGDHTTSASIEGAIQSGLRVADSLLSNPQSLRRGN